MDEDADANYTMGNSTSLDFQNETYDTYNINETFYYSYQYRLIGTFFNSIIFIVGVLGNMMVVAVVKRTRSMHSPTNCYLVSTKTKPW